MTDTQARRVTLYETGDGLWLYKVQAWNWRTLHESTQPTPRATVMRIIRDEYPDCEVVVMEK